MTINVLYRAREVAHIVADAEPALAPAELALIRFLPAGLLFAPVLWRSRERLMRLPLRLWLSIVAGAEFHRRIERPAFAIRTRLLFPAGVVAGGWLAFFPFTGIITLTSADGIGTSANRIQFTAGQDEVVVTNSPGGASPAMTRADFSSRSTFTSPPYAAHLAPVRVCPTGGDDVGVAQHRALLLLLVVTRRGHGAPGVGGAVRGQPASQHAR